MLKILGNNIRKIRKKRKISQQRFSKTIGIDRSYFVKIENGKKNPTVGMLKKIAKGLDTSVNKLCKDI